MSRDGQCIGDLVVERRRSFDQTFVLLDVEDMVLLKFYRVIQDRPNDFLSNHRSGGGAVVLRTKIAGVEPHLIGADDWSDRVVRERRGVGGLSRRKPECP